jgi:hypothetical protein
MRPTADALVDLVERFEPADWRLSNDVYTHGGLDAIFPRLARVHNAVAAFAGVQRLLDKGNEK